MMQLLQAATRLPGVKASLSPKDVMVTSDIMVSKPVAAAPKVINVPLIEEKVDEALIVEEGVSTTTRRGRARPTGRR